MFRYRKQPLPVCLEEFFAAFVIFIETDAVHPRGFFRVSQIFEALVFVFFTVTQLFVLTRLDVAEHQVIGHEAEFVAAIFAAILDAHLGVVLVATLLRGKCCLVPPFGESRTGEMVVQVAALGHVIKDPVQVFCSAVRFQLVKPVCDCGVKGQQQQRQCKEKFMHHHHPQRKTYLSAKINAMR
jgi:hypothetical protein